MRFFVIEPPASNAPAGGCGLKRVNVSLGTLDRDRFAELTGIGDEPGPNTFQRPASRSFC